jgi:hypothetical protein
MLTVEGDIAYVWTKLGIHQQSATDRQCSCTVLDQARPDFNFLLLKHIRKVQRVGRIDTFQYKPKQDISQKIHALEPNLTSTNFTCLDIMQRDHHAVIFNFT